MTTPDTSRRRLLFYTHDTFGMGHVRRCLNVIEAVAARLPDAAILLASGSPALRLLEKRSLNVDLLKLPTIAPTGEAANAPPVLPLPIRDIIRLRTKLMKTLVRAFAPHLFYVDNFPLGARRELEPVLEMLAAGSTRTVLGLRDILDDPAIIRQRWPRDGIDRVLSESYDRIFVFGEPRVFDVIGAYGLDGAVARKLDYCGYAARAGALPQGGDPFAEHGVPDGRRVLVTVGGGGDGLPLLRTSLEALQRLPDLAALVLTGPLQGAADRRSIEDAGQTLRSRVRCVPYVEDPRPLMAAADLVISMAGYNTVAELLSCHARMLLVPRDWRYGEHAKGTAAGVEKEQPLRAAKLAEAGLASVLEHARMTPDSLAAAICVALQRPRPDGGTFALDGATRAAATLCGMLGELADAA